MAKLKSIMMSGVVFYVIVVLIVGFWDGFRVSYDLEEEDLMDGKTVFEKLHELNLIAAINKLKTGIEKLTSIGSADFDILGGLATSAIGVVQTIGGIVTFPFQIFGIITGFYDGIIPPIIPIMLGLIVTVAVAVLLISAKLGFDFT